MFRVGQKVACIDASGLAGRGLSNNQVYVVSYVHYDGCIRVGFDPHSHQAYHAAYSSRRFRPIVERKTDISVFREILHKATKKVGESARAVEQAND
jgi:hypothetical protein